MSSIPGNRFGRHILVLIAAALSYPAAALDRRPAKDSPLESRGDLRILRAADGRVSRLYGAPLAFGVTPQRAAARAIEQHATLLGVAPADLASAGTQILGGEAFTAVYYRQHFDGIPVFRAWVTVLVRHDAGNGVVLISPELHDLRGKSAAPAVLDADAGVGALRAAHPDFSFGAPEQVVFVEHGQPLPAWRIDGGNSSESDPQAFEFVVEASTPAARIVWQDSRVYYESVAGTVHGYGTPGRLPDRIDNPPVPLALPELWVQIGDVAALTDLAGAFSADVAGVDPLMLALSLNEAGATTAGRWVRVVDRATPPQTIAFEMLVDVPNPIDILLNQAPSEFTTAQINGFIHTTLVHDFVKQINPNYPGVDVQMPCAVNLDSSCNAFYRNESIQFFRASESCPNMCYADVVYHEYGHHVVASGHPFANGSFHEGIADVTANLLTDSPCMSAGFFLGSDECLRTGDNSVSYPNTAEAHQAGMVISGAYWLLRERLRETQPADALAIVRRLYLDMIPLRPAGITPAICVDVLTLDDDDADLTNGTPHYFEITRAFALKNLRDVPDVAFAYPGGRPARISPLGGTRVRVAVSPGGLTPEAFSLQAQYRLDGGPLAPLAIEPVDANTADLVFPPLPCGAQLEWFVQTVTTGGAAITDPPDAPALLFTANVGHTLARFLADDFETDQGWDETRVNLPTGRWVRADPIGSTRGFVRAQPEDDNPAGFGAACWATGNSGRQIDSVSHRDVDGGPARLISPMLDLAGRDPHLRFAHWFYSQPDDDRLTVEVSNDGGANWVLVTEFAHDPTWRTHTFRLMDFVAPTAAVQIRFSTQDDPDNSVTEAAIDDVVIFEAGCDRAFQPGDSNCDGAVDAFDIGPFIAAMTDPGAYQLSWPECDALYADMDGDGLLTPDDVQAFVLELLNG